MENAFISSDGQGPEMRGTILRLGRFEAVFEIYPPNAILRTSQALSSFKVIVDGTLAYAGRAVVSNLIHMGSVTICEVKLDEPGVQAGVHSVHVNASNNGHSGFFDAYRTFFGKWQDQVKILPEFKMAVLDLQGYLWDLKSFLEQVELCIASDVSQSRSEIQLRVSQDLAGPILTAIDAMHERFEAAARQVPEESRGAYQVLVRRQLHPLFLCSPFGYRTYHKPLGYAGDYEIMNMIHRNTFEGGSLYAKLVHYWLVSQWAAKSVRNRVAYLKTKVSEVAVRACRANRVARILNLGCGPAQEVVEFISENPAADHAEFMLVDFDSETLDFVNARLAASKRNTGRDTPIQIRKMSVTDLIKESSRMARNPLGSEFDLIYCGGLFDYFSDRICKQLVGLFEGWLAPGGMLVVANMDDSQKPFRHMVELLLDWHLIYRNPGCLSAFIPEGVARDQWLVVSEQAAVNLFLELRKPPRD